MRKRGAELALPVRIKSPQTISNKTLHQSQKRKKAKKKKKTKNSKSASSSNFDSAEREADFDEDLDEMSYQMKCDTHRTKTTQLQCGIEYYVQSNKFTNAPATRELSDDEE